MLGAETSRWWAFSSGGALAVGLPLHLNALEQADGGCPDELSRCRPVSIPQFSKGAGGDAGVEQPRRDGDGPPLWRRIGKIMTKGQPVPVYMLSGSQKGILPACRRFHFYYEVGMKFSL